MLEPYGITIFCDSIRHEVSGKTTYVGVYQEHMIFDGNPPVVWPTLATVSTLLIPLEFTYENLRIDLTLESENGESKLLVSQPMKRHQSFSDNLIHPGKKIKMMSLTEMNIFELTGSGTIKARAYFDDLEVRLGTLQIIFNQSDKQP